MFIGFICLILFLFTSYQISQDDFIFLRRGVTTEHIFSIIFLGLPIALFLSRLFYILLHPSIRYTNPFIFFIIPYYPGLSLIGGLVGASVFVFLYTQNKKMPSLRVLDMLATAFLLCLSIGILLQAVVLVGHSRVQGLEEIGRSILACVFFLFFFVQFRKARWIEGSITFGIFCIYALLALLATGFSFLSHKPVSFASLVMTVGFFIISLGFFLQKQRIPKR